MNSTSLSLRLSLRSRTNIIAFFLFSVALASVPPLAISADAEPMVPLPGGVAPQVSELKPGATPSPACGVSGRHCEGVGVGVADTGTGHPVDAPSTWLERGQGYGLLFAPGFAILRDGEQAEASKTKAAIAEKIRIL